MNAEDGYTWMLIATLPLALDFGAFVQLPGFKKHGLVHKTQASKHFTEHISDVVAIGDQVWVKERPS